VRAALPAASPATLADRRDSVSTSTLPRRRGRISGYCWDEHPRTHVHCTDPAGHKGKHWHPYSKTSW
jgi:hypothetical protein